MIPCGNKLSYMQVVLLQYAWDWFLFIFICLSTQIVSRISSKEKKYLLFLRVVCEGDGG